MLRHGSSKTTDLYIHSVPEAERRAMDKIAEILFPTVPKSATPGEDQGELVH
jgi:hypothetical protein